MGKSSTNIYGSLIFLICSEIRVAGGSGGGVALGDKAPKDNLVYSGKCVLVIFIVNLVCRRGIRICSHSGFIAVEATH